LCARWTFIRRSVKELASADKEQAVFCSLQRASSWRQWAKYVENTGLVLTLAGSINWMRK